MFPLLGKKGEKKSDQLLSASLSRETKKLESHEKCAPASMPVGWVYVETKRSVNIPWRFACDVATSRGRNVVMNNRNAQNVSRTTLSSCS